MAEEVGDNAVKRQFSASLAEAKYAASQSKANKTTSAKSESIDIEEHCWTIDQICSFYKTDKDRGLTAAQVLKNRESFGANELTPVKPPSMCLLFIKELTGLFSLMLWFAGAMCFLAYGLDPAQVENLYLGVVLIVVVFMTGIFQFYQEFQSAEAMKSFKNMLPDMAVVIREGVESEALVKDLVRGDIVKVKLGERVPADLIMLEAANFKVDNASLTGESEPQKRSPRDDAKAMAAKEAKEVALEATNLAFFSCNCVSGSCTAVVIRTGDMTVIGKIAALASDTENVKTPIAIEIEAFIKVITVVAISLGVTFLIICFAKQRYWLDNIVFCIGIIVANVPEGLLATVTVSLTLTSKRMAKKKVLVKNLESVETLGSTNTIASDKTGTLTQNLMTVNHIWYDCKVWDAKFGASDDIYDKFDDQSPTFKKLIQVGALCNRATFMGEMINLQKPIQQRETNGDASESAFIKFCENVLRKAFFGDKDPLQSPKDQEKTAIGAYRAANERLGEIPFNSTNKFHVTIHMQDNDNNKDKVLLMKGAPEKITARCSHIMIDGERRVFTDELRAAFKADLDKLMFGGERCLGLCARDLEVDQFGGEWKPDTDPDSTNFPLEDMVFIGLFALIDPPRSDVPRAVKTCQAAGIKVVMVTGDHPVTAEAIAKEVNIIRPGMKTRRDLMLERGLDDEEMVDDEDPEIRAVVVKGSDLETMTPEKLSRKLDYDNIVFARTTPEQKLIIVKALQSKTWIHPTPDCGFTEPKPYKHIVAVTGDGVNDSPAIKKADIGIAMGKTGTQVAKDAADMILQNDNFASLVDGVEEGRLIFDNLKKSIAYTLSSNIPEITPFMAYVILGCPQPLSTILILCIDLGTDMVPAISMAYETAESNIMQRPPRDSRVERLVTAKLFDYSYMQIGVFQAAAGFFAYMVVMFDYGFHPSILPGRDLTFYAYEQLNEEYNAELSITEYAVWNGVDWLGAGEGALKRLNYTSKVWPAGSIMANKIQAEEGFGEFGLLCLNSTAAATIGNYEFVAANNVDNPGYGCVALSKCTYGWPGDMTDPVIQEETDCKKNGNTYCVSSLHVGGTNPCQVPTEAWYHSMTAFFISIIVVQWADLVCCKTRMLSLKQQGMHNLVLDFGLFFETALGALLVYVPPLNMVFKTRPLRIEHWFIAMPFSAVILTYDEIRKYLLRIPDKKEKPDDKDTYKNNWVYRNTYY